MTLCCDPRPNPTTNKSQLAYAENKDQLCTASKASRTTFSGKVGTKVSIKE